MLSMDENVELAQVLDLAHGILKLHLHCGALEVVAHPEEIS